MSDDRQTRTRAMARLEGFAKSYGEIQAVKNLDLEVRPGEAFVLLGSNGSGKSTILRAIAGLHRPTAGRVVVDGLDLAEDPVAAKRCLAYLPQRIDFPPLLTGREVLEFYAGLNGVGPGRVEAALDFVGLNSDADRFTRGYSGGMLQRLALGTAYLREVPLLLLDEPTLNLDPTGMRQFREWAERLRDRGVTVLFTAHVLHEALRLADRVGVMSEGELIGVQEVSGFRDQVVAASAVRLVVAGLTDEMVEAARRAGAREDQRNGKSYAFKAPPERRQRVIRAIEDSGGAIEELHTEPPDWESLVELLTEGGE